MPWSCPGHARSMPGLGGCILLLTTALASINCHQPALFDIKLPVVDNFPFMKATFAQGFTPVLIREFLFFEFKDIAHRLILQTGAQQIDNKCCDD